MWVRVELESILRIIILYFVGYGGLFKVIKWGVIYMLYVLEI